jgi:[acyl-carrier-protein] S-malonyltransferase
MRPAAEAMNEALVNVNILAPRVPVVANVTARPVTEPDEIRRALVAQVTGTVRWRESVAFMANAGVDRFLELGSGKVLTGLLKRIAEGAIGVAIGTPADIASYTARAA